MIGHVQVASSLGNQSYAERAVMNLAISASYADDDTVSYGATGLSTELSVDAATGVISGTLVNRRGPRVRRRLLPVMSSAHPRVAVQGSGSQLFRPYALWKFHQRVASCTRRTSVHVRKPHAAEHSKVNWILRETTMFKSAAMVVLSALSLVAVASDQVGYVATLHQENFTLDHEQVSFHTHSGPSSLNISVDAACVSKVNEGGAPIVCQTRLADRLAEEIGVGPESRQHVAPTLPGRFRCTPTEGAFDHARARARVIVPCELDIQ